MVIFRFPVPAGVDLFPKTYDLTIASDHNLGSVIMMVVPVAAAPGAEDLAADGGVDAVGTYQQIGFDRAAVAEGDRDAVGRLSMWVQVVA